MSTPRRSPARLVVAFAILVGAFAGVVVSAILIGIGVLRLDGPAGACIHYGSTLVLAAAVGAPGRWRQGARPRAATALVAILITFAIRRWIDGWVNLAALDWGSGAAGTATALVFPLEGLVLGALIAADSLRPGHDGVAPEPR
jgi:hypothetical protein